MIEIRNLFKTYEGQKIVDNLSLEIPRGRVFGFLGPNGAGKTTVMKMIVGITLPDDGIILIDNESPSDLKIRERIGFMPEAPYFYERLTGLEFMRFCGELFGMFGEQETYKRLLERVGLYGSENKSIFTYSKGMKQRLGFAQALINNPDYIFLDEPLDGLDPIGRREIKKIIKDLKKEGRTIFFNSHILYDTEELCDDIGVIHQGKLLYSGPLGEFSKNKTLEDQFISAIESDIHENFKIQ